MDTKGQGKFHQVNDTTHKGLSLCPGCVLFPILGKNKVYFDGYGHKTLTFTKIADFICVLECINMDTNQSQMISFDKTMKSRHILYHRREKESLTAEQT